MVREIIVKTQKDREKYGLTKYSHSENGDTFYIKYDDNGDVFIVMNLTSMGCGSINTIKEFREKFPNEYSCYRGERL